MLQLSRICQWDANPVALCDLYRRIYKADCKREFPDSVIRKVLEEIFYQRDTDGELKDPTMYAVFGDGKITKENATRR